MSQQSSVTQQQIQPADEIFLIGELAQVVGLDPNTIRFYEREGLLAPPKHGRIRLYKKSDLDHLMVIKKLRQYGFSIEKLRKLLELEGTSFVFGVIHNPKSAELLQEQLLETTNAVTSSQSMLIDFQHCVESAKMVA